MPIDSMIRKHLILPLWALKNKDKRFKYYKRYKKLQYLSEEALKERQLHKLKQIFIHAYNNTDYYREIFKKVGFDPKQFNDLSQLADLPILSKVDIQKSTDELIAKNYNKDSLLPFKTGGSTGKSITVYSNRERLERGVGAGLLCLGWAGSEVGHPIARVWGNPPIPKTLKQRIKAKWLEPAIWLDTMDLTPGSMNQFVEEWKKAKPKLLHGHAHSLYKLSLYLKEKSIDNLRPTGVVSTSMMLLSKERKVIEEVFGVRVINLYGCEEVGLISCECDRHEGMHLNVLNNYIECLKDDGSLARYGEEGTIVVTSLTNYGMPIIRYKIEDNGILTDHKCSCGRGLPLMEKISGRVADFLVKPDGGLVAGISLIERTLTKINGIEQMQIIQENMGLIHINLVRNDISAKNIKNELNNEFKKVFGEHIVIQINPVDEIKREKSGKYRFSICKVK